MELWHLRSYHLRCTRKVLITPHCCVFDALAVQNRVPWPTAHCGFGAHVAQKFVPWSMQQIHFRHLYDQRRSHLFRSPWEGHAFHNAQTGRIHTVSSTANESSPALIMLHPAAFCQEHD